MNSETHPQTPGIAQNNMLDKGRSRSEYSATITAEIVDMPRGSYQKLYENLNVGHMSKYVRIISFNLCYNGNTN